MDWAENAKSVSSDTLEKLAREACRDELTDYTVYRKLSKLRIEKNPQFRQILNQLADTEHRHYEFWSKYIPGAEIRVSKLRVYTTILVRILFGTTFASRFLERNESEVIKRYKAAEKFIPDQDRVSFDSMLQDEVSHEKEFEQKTEGSAIKYISFVVLGLADAVVEIAGIHAGSLGIYDSTRLAGLAGVIAGAAASIAMASAAYAQAKQGFQGSASKSAAYTGISYFATALILATPYFVTEKMTYALGVSLTFAVALIAFISFYSSVISDKPFTRDFLEMTGIMFGATAALYILGTIIHIFVGIPLGL
jgi:vacuolar iron transporter family protein